jgi:hypothetical protein
MISVATLALVAGTGFANAQGTGMSREAPSAAPAQQSAPSSERGTTGGQVNREMKSTQTDQKSPGAAKNQRAEENMQGSKTKNQGNERADQAGQNRDKTVGQSTKSEGRDQNMKSEGREESDKNAQRSDQKMNKESDKNAQRTDQKMNKENAQRTDEKTKNENAQRTDEKMNNENAQRTDQKMGNEAEGKGGRTSQTVGQAGAGAKLSSEQRTKITTVIRDQRVAPVAHVNFAISVGTRVPRDVTFHPLPAEVVTIYPEWRGYEFILVGDQIVVVDPRSFEIVAVLDA